jgi:hypothetical protein
MLEKGDIEILGNCPEIRQFTMRTKGRVVQVVFSSRAGDSNRLLCLANPLIDRLLLEWPAFRETGRKDRLTNCPIHSCPNGCLYAHVRSEVFREVKIKTVIVLH